MTATIVTINDRQFKHFAHPTHKIRKVGTNEVYDEAYDVLDATYEYEVTEELKEVNNG